MMFGNTGTVIGQPNVRLPWQIRPLMGVTPATSGTDSVPAAGSAPTTQMYGMANPPGLRGLLGEGAGAQAPARPQSRAPLRMPSSVGLGGQSGAYGSDPYQGLNSIPAAALSGNRGDPYQMTDAAAWLANQRDYNNLMSSYTLNDAGNAFGVRQGMNIWNQGMGAAQNVADNVNRSFDQYQFYADRNADRDLKMQMLNRLLGGLGNLNFGGGGGGGGRMTGFQDTASAQGASLPGGGGTGQYTTNITAGPVPQAAVNQAMTAMKGGGAAAPASSIPTSPGAAPAALARQTRQAAANSGAINATNLDRQMAQSNADLKLKSESARAAQGTDLASLLASMNRDNVNNDIARLRAMSGLYGGVINGLFSAIS